MSMLHAGSEGLATNQALMSSREGDMPEISKGASRVGADLQAARDRLGWGIADVAASLRIRAPYLSALEQGRLGELPGPAYAVGFLRTYATLLGLDADEMARRFRAEVAEVNGKTRLQFPAPVSERGVPAGAVVLLGVLLAIGGYFAWYRLSGDRAGPERITAPPERLLADDTALPAPPGRAPAASQDGTAAVAGAAAVPNPTGANAPGANPFTGSPSGANPADRAPAATAEAQPGAPPPSLPQVSATSAAAAVPPPGQRVLPAPATPPGVRVAEAISPAQLSASHGGASAETGEAVGESRITLRADADAWVQVRDRQGQVVFNRVLRAGETWRVPTPPAGEAPLLLTTGNAGQTAILVDGVAAPSVGRTRNGRPGQVGDAQFLRPRKLHAPKPPPPAPPGPRAAAGAGGGARGGAPRGRAPRDLVLDPELLRQGKLPAQIATARAGAHPPAAAAHP